MLKEQSKILCKAIGHREGVEETGNKKSILGRFLKKRWFEDNKKSSKFSLIYVHGSFLCQCIASMAQKRFNYMSKLK